MSTTHDLKTWPEHFDAVVRGDKPFEVRKNDRDFRVEDLLRLREFEPALEGYTGRELTARVSHVLRGGQFGIKEGYCVLGLQVSAAAAVVIARDPSGLMLFVSRKKDPTKFGPPGGMVEPGESPEAAAVRELAEEAGVRDTPSELHLFNVHLDEGRRVHVFMLMRMLDPSEPQRQPGEGHLRWAPRLRLFDPEFCPFALALRTAMPDFWAKAREEGAGQ